MKLVPPKNENYAATIVKVRSIVELPGLDNLVGVPVLGYQALTTKADVKVGDLMVAFTAETQLADVFAAANNLYRHSNLNADYDKTGYLEDNRRVRAIKLRGHRSDALLMPLSSLGEIGFADWHQLQEGDTFDELNGVEICRKYVVKTRTVRGQNQAIARILRVDERQFPKHFDTANYFRNAEMIGFSELAVITQKLHGTSVRVGNVLVRRKLSRLERLVTWVVAQARKTGWSWLCNMTNIAIKDREYAYVYGSRNVVKDPDNPFVQEHFYGEDIHTIVGQRLKGLLPKGYVVYGEIIGWVPGTSKPIQPDYTYQLAEGTAELYVYRVVRVNEDGNSVDLSWDQVKEFCAAIGVRVVPEVARGIGFSEELVRSWLDVRFADHVPGAVPTDPGQVDEGICIRKEGLVPLILKAKSPIFLQHETALLDKGVEDIETTEDVEVLDVDAEHDLGLGGKPFHVMELSVDDEANVTRVVFEREACE